MRRQGVAIGCAVAALAGCGGGDSGGGTTEGPSESPLSRYIGKLPIGYRFVPAPLPQRERAFREKLSHDFETTPDAIEIRSVHLGAQFVAGIVVLRAGRDFTTAEIVDKVTPGHLPTVRIKIGGKKALLVVGKPTPYGKPDVSIVDTVGRVMLVVTAQRYPVARKIAARVVRSGRPRATKLAPRRCETSGAVAPGWRDPMCAMDDNDVARRPVANDVQRTFRETERLITLVAVERSTQAPSV
jgi:hypothetical protein